MIVHLWLKCPAAGDLRLSTGYITKYNNTELMCWHVPRMLCSSETLNICIFLPWLLIQPCLSNTQVYKYNLFLEYFSSPISTNFLHLSQHVYCQDLEESFNLPLWCCGKLQRESVCVLWRVSLGSGSSGRCVIQGVDGFPAVPSVGMCWCVCVCFWVTYSSHKTVVMKKWRRYLC